MDHLLIVDGSNLLFQMFYGMPARILGAQGQPIQGTLGFVGALLKILRRVEPTHVLVVFDGECANERTALDPDYKANREDLSQLPQEDTPFGQMPDVFAALDCLGICHKETRDCEADDWIAGYALTWGRKGRVTILSQDSDFFQLITANVTVCRYRGDGSRFCDVAYIAEKLGIRPEQYPDHKALTGDNADNIKGAPRIGPKTATALLRRFGSLEGILANTQAVEKPSIRASLEENAQRLRRNYQLIHLDGSALMPFAREELAFCDTGVTTTQILRRLGLLV